MLCTHFLRKSLLIRLILLWSIRAIISHGKFNEFHCNWLDIHALAHGNCVNWLAGSTGRPDILIHFSMVVCSCVSEFKFLYSTESNVQTGGKSNSQQNRICAMRQQQFAECHNQQFKWQPLTFRKCVILIICLPTTIVVILIEWARFGVHFSFRCNDTKRKRCRLLRS